MYSSNGNEKMKLLIGANENEKLIFYYNNKLIKEKIALHLIPSGKWVNFWLQIRRGEIMLGYEGVPVSLFEWHHEDSNKAFEPFFLSYKSIAGKPLGVSFKCEECHTENTTSEYFTKILPVGMWKETQGTIHNNFTIKLRGKGIISIPLMNVPREGIYYLIYITERELSYNIIMDKSQLVLMKRNFDYDFIRADKWTDLLMEFDENTFNISANGTTVLDYYNWKPMLIYWFSVGVRNGWVTWSANCEPLDIDGPPLDGGWSEWSKWQCSVACGGGEGYRTRTCSNPRPNIFGQLCQGTHTSTGKCHDFPCGEISPITLEKLRMRLRSEQYSFTVEENDMISLPNNHEILGLVRDESPNAYFEWTQNGIIIKPEQGRKVVRDDSVIIHKAKVSDMGVYVSMIYRVNKKRVVLRVITLVVTTVEYTVSTRATLPLTLKSNAVILGYIYSDLSQMWTLNDIVYKDYGVTTLAAVNAEKFDSLNESHTGVWKCVISQRDLKLSWVTNWLKVKVKKAPNIYTHLMEDSLTAPLFGWMKYDGVVLSVLIFIILFVFGGVTFAVYAYLEWVKLPEKKHKRKKYEKLAQAAD